MSTYTVAQREILNETYETKGLPSEVKIKRCCKTLGEFQKSELQSVEDMCIKPHDEAEQLVYCVGDEWLSMSFGGSEAKPDARLFPRPEEQPEEELHKYANCWPTRFKKHYENSHNNFVSTSTIKITRGNQIQRLESRVRSCANDFRRKQWEHFTRILNEKGFTETRAEPAIAREIQIRQRQYPNSKIYVLVGREIRDYFDNLHFGRKWNNAEFIYKQVRYNESGLGVWDSAIFAEEQIRTNHELISTHTATRIPRWWILSVSMVMKFVIEVDEWSDVVPERTTSLGRFADIEH